MTSYVLISLAATIEISSFSLRHLNFIQYLIKHKAIIMTQKRTEVGCHLEGRPWGMCIPPHSNKGPCRR